MQGSLATFLRNCPHTQDAHGLNGAKKPGLASRRKHRVSVYMGRKVNASHVLKSLESLERSCDAVWDNGSGRDPGAVFVGELGEGAVDDRGHYVHEEPQLSRKSSFASSLSSESSAVLEEATPVRATDISSFNRFLPPPQFPRHERKGGDAISAGSYGSLGKGHRRGPFLKSHHSHSHDMEKSAAAFFANKSVGTAVGVPTRPTRRTRPDEQREKRSDHVRQRRGRPSSSSGFRHFLDKRQGKDARVPWM